MATLKTILIILIVYGIVMLIILTQFPVKENIIFQMLGIKIVSRPNFIWQEDLMPLLACIIAGLVLMLEIVVSYWLDERSSEKCK